MKLAIIDDDINFGEQFKIKLLDLFDENVEIDVYTDVEKKIFYKQYDLVFQDILLADKESFDDGEHLLQFSPETLLIYISNYDHFVFDTYKQKTFYFIRKSKLDNDLANFYVKFTKYISQKNLVVDLLINSQTIKIPQNDILYAHSLIDQNKIDICTKNGHLGPYITLKRLMLKLDPVMFYRFNSHTIINLKYVQSIEKDCLIMIDNEKIYFTKNSKPKFLYAYAIFKQRSVV